MELPTLHDGDIRLVPLGREHAAGMDDLAHDEGMEFTRVPTPVPDGFGAEWVDRYVRGRADGTRIGFAVCDRDDAFLGFVAFVELDLPGAQGEAGYILASKARGQGVATRAMRLLVAWAFDELKLERVELRIDVDNVASIRVAEHLGFDREGVLRSVHVKDGIRADVAVYSRLRRDGARDLA